MTGAQLLAFIRRRLAENGLATDAERQAQLSEWATRARDKLLIKFARNLNIPIGKTKITLVSADATDDRLWKIPDATKDPLRVFVVRDKVTRERFSPSTAVDHDGGDYEWEDIRRLRLAEGAGDATNGIEIIAAVSQASIDQTTLEAAIGLPVPCHAAIGHLAAVLALTANEESDAGNEKEHLAEELEDLESLYGDYDANGGFALREAMLEGAGDLFIDTIY